MSLNYLVSDTLARIQNGLTANLTSIEVLNSNYIVKILNVLYTEGFILGYQFIKTNESVQKYIQVYLKYNLYGKPLINHITILSTPGLRKYVTVTELIQLRKQNITLNNLYIVSTSQGVMSDLKAIQTNLGGELICKIN